MRRSFVEALSSLAAKDRRILLLSGDLGFMCFEDFSRRFPNQFFNMGVAEQNMLGVAAGLAKEGFIPYVYSIAPFVSLRAFEAFRNGAIHHNLPVRMVGVGGGFEYGMAGATHFALEDIGVMRTQPDLSIIAPADSKQTYNAFKSTSQLPGPVYYRIGKTDGLEVPGLDGRFSLDGLHTVRGGEDLLLIASGSLAINAVKAAHLLQDKGVEATVAVVSVFAPAPNGLAELLKKHSYAFSVEAHYRHGGLGTLCGETIAANKISCKLVNFGIRYQTAGRTGSAEWHHEQHGLNPESIARRCLEEVDKLNR